MLWELYIVGKVYIGIKSGVSDMLSASSLVSGEKSRHQYTTKVDCRSFCCRSVLPNIEVNLARPCAHRSIVPCFFEEF